LTFYFYYMFRQVPITFFLFSFIIAMFFLGLWIVLYFKDGRKDPSLLWSYALGTAAVMTVELIMGILQIRNLGAGYNIFISITMGLFEGGTLTSLFAALTKIIISKKYKTLLYITLICIGLAVALLFMIPLSSGVTYQSFRAMSHPFSMLSFSVWYVFPIVLFWIFPPPEDRNVPRTAMTDNRKSLIIFYLSGIVYSSLFLALWIPTGNRAIFFGPWGGPYVLADPLMFALWMAFNNFVENISIFIGPYAIGMRLGLIKSTPSPSLT